MHLGQALKVPACSQGHFRGPGEHTRARRDIVALSMHTMGCVNTKDEESTAKDALAGCASSDAVTFRSRSRASVLQNNAMVSGSVDLSELVRARRGVVATDACTTRVADALLSVAGQASQSSSPAFRAVSCVKTTAYLLSKTLQAHVHVRTPEESAAALSAPAKVTTRQCGSVSSLPP